MNLGLAQSNYLKITRSHTENDFIKYPPGTEFQLKDENDSVVFSNTSKEKSFNINKPYTLVVNPPYKTSSNTYYLKKGKVEIKSNIAYYDTQKEHNKTKKKKEDYGMYNYDAKDFTKSLSMKKTMTPSTLNPKMYNATFEFNNGIVATYNDGEMTATLNDENLKIQGYYVIYSKDGIIKLSFRPKTGETWWVFEPVEESKN
ncbi:hypothetical protein BWZ20_13895 [Winogradskyella sp. J14-2]|nr:hypothetical protein BWZ20_13895 [Winogradskyella sp. J14-2]